MGFVDNLQRNPNGGVGGSGIFGLGGEQRPDYATPLNIVNQLKDREMIDYKNKALFDADLNARQGMRMRSLFDPSGVRQQANQPGSQPGQGMNYVMARDPDELTGYQKGELGIRNRQADIESQRVAQTGKMGQQALDIKDAQQKLNQEKSNQIDEIKKSDMQRKIDDSAAKIEMAQKVLESRDSNAAAQLEAHKALAAAVEERHKLEMAQKDEQFKTTSEQHAATIKALQDRIDQAGHSETTTEVNPEGNKKTVTTNKGSTVTVTGKDGKSYQIPANKVDDWKANHAGQ